MAQIDVKQPIQETPKRQLRDLPGCIKWILLLLLIVLLIAEIATGEFNRFSEGGWLTWIILMVKLILIIGIFVLIWVQRNLKCSLTEPTGCTEEESDPVLGKLFVRVKGTASGAVFGHYTLEISGPYTYSVIYPAGGGTVPVVGGELGRIDTTALDHGNYTITLRVFPIGTGSSKSCSKTFTLLKVAVYITRAAGVSAVPNCFDETAELVSGDVRSLGGLFHLDGSAYVFGCVDRKIERYELRYARVNAPGPGPLQPITDAVIPADWPASNYLHTPLIYDPSKYWPWTEVGQVPTNLINDWGSMHIGPPSPGGIDYPILSPKSWNSYTATSNPGGGRYNVLLIVSDTAGHRYYDLQRIWLDNWHVFCQIVKFQKPGEEVGTWEDIPHCTDILLSWQKLRIIGLAWDALIDSDPLWPTTAPNDNFNKYRLSYRKEFVAPSDAAEIPITATPDYPALASNVRVPNTLTIVPGPLPTAADADLLVEWDLKQTLDMGMKGDCDASIPHPNENKLYRKCSCTYTLSLEVSDKTVTESVSDYNIHHRITYQPIKIVNDL